MAKIDFQQLMLDKGEKIGLYFVALPIAGLLLILGVMQFVDVPDSTAMANSQTKLAQDKMRAMDNPAGEPDPLCDALEGAIGVAIEEIDMEGHSGEHPRIGAVDVVPFVPLAGTTMEETIALARSFGRRVADRFDLPVYLYANAAARPDRVKLADVRRGGYEGLKLEIGQRGREPDWYSGRSGFNAVAFSSGVSSFTSASSSSWSGSSSSSSSSGSGGGGSSGGGGGGGGGGGV